MLEQESQFHAALADEAVKFEAAWGECPYLTPRQASSIATVLSTWADLYIREWLREAAEPLHEVPPFDGLDLRVMMLVGENRAWAAKFAERCLAERHPVTWWFDPGKGSGSGYLRELALKRVDIGSD